MRTLAECRCVEKLREVGRDAFLALESDERGHSEGCPLYGVEDAPRVEMWRLTAMQGG